MTIPAIHPHPKAADISIERLSNNSTVSEEDKLAEASRQFEALLLRQILQSTQNPVIKSKFSDTSTAGSIYRDMVTNQLSDSMSKSGAFGFAKTFEKQLSHQAKLSDKHTASTNTVP